MATSSFDRAFTVKDKKAATVLINELQHGQHVTITRRNIEAESKKGAQLLAHRLRSA